MYEIVKVYSVCAAGPLAWCYYANTAGARGWPQTHAQTQAQRRDIAFLPEICASCLSFSWKILGFSDSYIKMAVKCRITDIYRQEWCDDIAAHRACDYYSKIR